MFMNNISNSFGYTIIIMVESMLSAWNLTDHNVFEAWTSPNKPYQYNSPRGLVYGGVTKNLSFLSTPRMEETIKS